MNSLFQEAGTHNICSGNKSRHKPTRVNFPKNTAVVSNLDHEWQIGLIDISKCSKENNVKMFILLLINIIILCTL